MTRVSPEPNTGCWLWAGSACRTGYGTVKISGKVLLVHRVLFALMVREPRGELDLDHLCRNRWCVNPSHLDEVTHAVNMRRASKLSPEDVATIRGMIEAGVRRVEVAARFDVHVVTVGQIVRGDRWGDEEWLRGSGEATGRMLRELRAARDAVKRAVSR